MMTLVRGQWFLELVSNSDPGSTHSGGKAGFVTEVSITTDLGYKLVQNCKLGVLWATFAYTRSFYQYKARRSNKSKMFFLSSQNNLTG